MAERTSAIDRELARRDPGYRLAELERANTILRRQVDRLIVSQVGEEAASGFAMQLLARGIRTPGRMRLGADGQELD